MTRRRREENPTFSQEKQAQSQNNDPNHNESNPNQNHSTERFRKLHLKGSMPKNASALNIIRKRDRIEKNSHDLVEKPPASDSYRSVTLRDDPSSTTTVKSIKSTGKRIIENYSNVVDPKHVAPSSAFDILNVPFPEPRARKTYSDIEQTQNHVNMDIDDPSITISCPDEPQMTKAANENFERKNNFQNIVTEIRMKAKHHHHRNTVSHGDKSPISLTTRTLQNMFDLRSHESSREGIFHIHNKRRKSSEKQVHPNTSNWLGSRGNPFSRHPQFSSNRNEDTEPDGALERQALPSVSNQPLKKLSPSNNLELPHSAPVAPSDDLENLHTTNPARLPFAKHVPLFGGRFFNHQSAAYPFRAEISASDGSVTESDRFVASGVMAWTRRLDWKKRPNMIRRARSWSNTNQEIERNSLNGPSETDESLHLTRLNEEVRRLHFALLRSEQALSQLGIQVTNQQQETCGKLKRLSAAHNSLSDAQEIRFRSALDVLNDNQKVLGYVESNFDYVLSILGSGRRRCPGLLGHFLGALRYLGDNTIGFVFKIIRYCTCMYARLKRMAASISGTNFETD